MSDAVNAALVTGGLSLAGVVVTAGVTVTVQVILTRRSNRNVAGAVVATAAETHRTIGEVSRTLEVHGALLASLGARMDASDRRHDQSAADRTRTDERLDEVAVRQAACTVCPVRAAGAPPEDPPPGRPGVARPVPRLGPAHPSPA